MDLWFDARSGLIFLSAVTIFVGSLAARLNSQRKPAPVLAPKPAPEPARSLARRPRNDNDD
jgi:hypothetical protein